MNSFFLVLVNFSLVAKDVTATLEQMGIGDPLVANSEDEALGLLTNLEAGNGIKLAVVQVAPASFAVSALREVLERLGAKVVLLHDSLTSDHDLSPYPILSLPFFTEDLEGIVSKITRSTPEPA